jgi:universal stress protein F
MYKNILIPVAPEQRHDTGEALAIARRLLVEGGRITLLSVLEQVPPYAAEYLPDNYIKKNVEEMRTRLKADAGGVKDVEIDVVSGPAGATITDYAGTHEIDLIVIASHRPGLKDYFLGSTASRVVRHAPSAVHVLR